MFSLLFLSFCGKGQEQVSDVYFDELQTPLFNTSSVLESYSVYNAQGQEVLNNSSNESEIINIDQLHGGHYIISGFGNNGLLYASKFVKVE